MTNGINYCMILELKNNDDITTNYSLRSKIYGVSLTKSQYNSQQSINNFSYFKNEIANNLIFPDCYPMIIEIPHLSAYTDNYFAYHNPYPDPFHYLVMFLDCFVNCIHLRFFFCVFFFF